MPSTFLSKTPKDFERAVEKLSKEYGYAFYAVTVGERIDTEETRWHSIGNVMCDGLVEVLEHLTDYMRSEIDKHGGDEPTEA